MAIIYSRFGYFDFQFECCWMKTWWSDTCNNFIVFKVNFEFWDPIEVVRFRYIILEIFSFHIKIMIFEVTTIHRRKHQQYFYDKIIFILYCEEWKNRTKERKLFNKMFKCQNRNVHMLSLFNFKLSLIDIKIIQKFSVHEMMAILFTIKSIYNKI